MKKNNLIVMIFLIGALFLNPISYKLYANAAKSIEVLMGVNIVIKGEKLIPKDANGKNVPVFIHNGTTYLPVRAISEFFNKKIDWEASTNTVHIGNNPLPGKKTVYIGKGIDPVNVKDNRGSYEYEYKDDKRGFSTYRKDTFGINDYNHYNYLRLRSGIGLDRFEPSYVKLEFPTEKKYSNFRAKIADYHEKKGRDNRTELKIFADDKLVYKKIITPSFKGEDIDVDIKGAIRVGIEYSTIMGDRAYVVDEIILTNPRFIE